MTHMYVTCTLPKAWQEEIAAIRSAEAIEGCERQEPPSLYIDPYSVGRVGGWVVMKVTGDKLKGKKKRKLVERQLQDLARAMEDVGAGLAVVEYSGPAMKAKAKKRVAVKAEALAFFKVLQARIDAVANIDSLVRMRHEAYIVWARDLEYCPELWEAFVSMFRDMGIPESLLEDEAAEAADDATIDDEAHLVEAVVLAEDVVTAGVQFDATLPHRHLLRQMQGLVVDRYLHAMVAELFRRLKLGKGGIKRGTATRTKVAISSMRGRHEVNDGGGVDEPAAAAAVAAAGEEPRQVPRAGGRKKKKATPRRDDGPMTAAIAEKAANAAAAVQGNVPTAIAEEEAEVARQGRLELAARPCYPLCALTACGYSTRTDQCTFCTNHCLFLDCPVHKKKPQKQPRRK